MQLFSEKQFLEQLTTFIFIEYLENIFLKHNQLPKICSENVFLSFSLSYENIALWMLKMPSLEKNLDFFFLGYTNIKGKYIYFLQTLVFECSLKIL